jgi:hypothetical protein
MSVSGRTMFVIASVAAMLAAGAWGHAQVQPPQPIPGQAPLVLSGGDLGFRVARRHGDKVVGNLVVRINGQWLDAETASGLKQLTLK